jgi:hypothetical protein
MTIDFTFNIGDRVRIAARGDARGKVKGLFVGEDGRRQVSVAYIDAEGDPAGPEWFGEGDLATG